MEEPGFFWPRTRLSTEVGKKKKRSLFFSEKIWGRRIVEEGENENDLEREVQDLTKM